MSMAEPTTILEPQMQNDFVETPAIKEVTTRALGYIKAGFPIHLRGISGTGKTTLAMHIAAQLERPMVLVHGDEEFSTSNLVGSENGYSFRKVRDNFIHSVFKEEEDMRKLWVDNRLTVACRHGFTLIYDEFTRSRPEANNVLLSVLQERMLDIPSNGGHRQNSFIKVHQSFTAIFTSNPEEYAGVHRSQDALRDRMVTLDLDYFDEETEVGIVHSRAQIAFEDAQKIVQIVRGLRDSEVFEFAPTIRGCLMIAKTARVTQTPVHNNPAFRQICIDILSSETTRIGSKATKEKVTTVLLKLIDQICNGKR